MRSVVPLDKIKRVLNDVKEWRDYFGDSETIAGEMHGIHQKHKAGHTRMAWDMRCDPNVMERFATLWNCKVTELETSFDAINYGRSLKNRKPNEWFHTDQRAGRKGLWMVQGFVCLTPQGPEMHKGALVVREGGHLAHESFFAKYPEAAAQCKKDWYRFTKVQKKDKHLQRAYEEHFPEDKYPTRHVEADPGDLVLWLSSTPHYGRRCYYFDRHTAGDPFESKSIRASDTVLESPSDSPPIDPPVSPPVGPPDSKNTRASDDGLPGLESLPGLEITHNVTTHNVAMVKMVDRSQSLTVDKRLAVDHDNDDDKIDQGHQIIPSPRCVIYVCFAPRSMMSPSLRKKKHLAFVNLRMTSHSPIDVNLFGEEISTFRMTPKDIKEMHHQLALYMERSLGSKLIFRTSEEIREYVRNKYPAAMSLLPEPPPHTTNRKGVPKKKLGSKKKSASRKKTQVLKKT